MTDKTLLKVETAESVALELVGKIATKVDLSKKSDDFRKDYLDLYAE